MGYYWQRWLADELREAGLKVKEVEGWKNRGRPASTGHFNPNGCSTVHHTGSKSSSTSPYPSLTTLIQGRSDLPGPLSQIAVGYDGTVFVIAAGRCNHAGSVGKSGVPGMPLGADGNALSIGNEVMTDGTQKMPAVQIEAIAKAHAVVTKHFNKTAERVHRHADISGTGKWDIGQLTTGEIRSLVKDAMEEDVALTEDEVNRIAKAVLNVDISNKGEKPLTVRQALRQASNSPKVVRKETSEIDDALDQR